MGHSFTKYVSDNNATCDTDSTETAKCDRCDKTDTRVVEGTALGHDWGEPTYTWAEDSSTVTASRVCKRDGNHVETETVKTEVSSDKKETYDATYTKEGQITYIARFTNEAFGIQKNGVPVPVLDPVVITFDAAGGQFEAAEGEEPAALATVSGAPKDKFKAPANPTRKGYTFLGWEPEMPGAIPEESVTLTAQWLANITKIEKLADIQSTYKPELEAALALMPTTVQVTLADNTTEKATLTWDKTSCKDYAKLEGDIDYPFVAADLTTKGGNVLNEGVQLPTCLIKVAPATSKDGQYVYRLDAGDTLTIVAWKGADEELVVPEQIDGHDVVAVGAEAFRDKKKLTSLTLPDGVKSIGDSAFAGCVKLEEVSLPDSITSVGKDIFLDDAALTRLTLVASLETTLKSDSSFQRKPIEGETPKKGEKNMPLVTLPLPITDFDVFSPAFTIGCDYTVAKGCSVLVQEAAAVTVSKSATVTNLGTVANFGAVQNDGKIVSCGGTWAENAPAGNALVTEHSYKDGKCKVCGAKEKITVTELTVKYNGDTLTKVYDKTRNVINSSGTWLLSKKLDKSKDFTLSGIDKAHKKVEIKKIYISKFDKADAGSYKLSVRFDLGGDDAEWYTARSTTIPAKITKRPVYVAPYSGLKKVYGADDPSTLGVSCKVEKGGLILTKEEQAAYEKGELKLVSGRMSREPGEDVGTYKFTLGTLDFGNANYDVQIRSEVFTIEKKSINSTDVGMSPIGNQRYTGKTVTPAVTLRYRTFTLKEGTDFKAEFSNNIKPSSDGAKVKLTGIGNYTGERSATFLILNITSDFSSGTSGSYTHTGFDSSGFEDMEDGDDFFDDDEEDGDGDDEDADAAENGDDDANGVGHLSVNDVDYGTILFGSREEPMPFILFEDEQENGERVLTIIPDPLEDEETGESVLNEDGTRELYPELHLRLGTTLVQTLMQQNVTEIVYELEQATLRIPLASLVSELPMTPVPGDGEGIPVEDEDDGDEEEGIPLDEADELAQDDEDEAGETPDEEAQSVGETAFAADMLQVESYDIRVEQADATGLTEREQMVLEGLQLMVPAYRVSIRAIPVGAEQVPSGAVDEFGQPVMRPVSQPLPEGVYLENVTLALLPDENLSTAPEGAQAVWLSLVEQEGDADESELTPAEFVEEDGSLVARVLLTADGLYAVSAPEGWDPEAFAEDGEGEDFEDEDFEDEDFEEDLGDEEDFGGDSEGFEDMEDGDDFFDDEDIEGDDVDTYVLNTNTKVFHRPSCRSVKQMSDKNKKTVTESRAIISDKYKPCDICNP